MKLSDSLRRITRCHERMWRHTSLRVGGTVRYFIEPRSAEEFRLAYQACLRAGKVTRVLGRGCNVLVADGYHDWAVISTRRLNRYRRMGHRVRADAGMNLPRLVAHAERWGLGGLEPLAGIPGSVGGAVAMNAGGHSGCIGDRLVSARVAFPEGPAVEVGAPELGLGYRSSRLVDGHPCLLSATFELGRSASRRLRRTRCELVARKRASQPLDARSAGCVFRNPPGGSAGRLIDQAGLKDTVVGDAVVSPQHANFILNRGRATASDVLELLDLVRHRVHDLHGVWLDLEVQVWRNTPDDLPRLHSPRKEWWPWASLTSPASPSSTVATPTNATCP